MPTDQLTDQLRELWELVDQLGELSHRLQRAADAAVHALGTDRPPPEEKPL